MKFFLFGSLRTLKRRAKDVDLAVDLDGEPVEWAMLRVAAAAPRIRKPVELWLSRSETEPNLAGNYDFRSGRWAFWRRPGRPGFFKGLELVTLEQVVRLAQAQGPYGPMRRPGTPEVGVDCEVRRGTDGWGFELAGRWRDGYPGPLEAAAAAEAEAKASGELGPEHALWFRLEAEADLPQQQGGSRR
jgi:hypothetical protein